eukprot:3016326-Lingulodinium_polyedra.AAC.1
MLSASPRLCSFMNPAVEAQRLYRRQRHQQRSPTLLDAPAQLHSVHDDRGCNRRWTRRAARRAADLPCSDGLVQLAAAIRCQPQNITRAPLVDFGSGMELDWGGQLAHLAGESPHAHTACGRPSHLRGVRDVTRRSNGDASDASPRRCVPYSVLLPAGAQHDREVAALVPVGAPSALASARIGIASAWYWKVHKEGSVAQWAAGGPQWLRNEHGNLGCRNRRGWGRGGKLSTNIPCHMRLILAIRGRSLLQVRTAGYS